MIDKSMVIVVVIFLIGCTSPGFLQNKAVSETKAVSSSLVLSFTAASGTGGGQKTIVADFTKLVKEWRVTLTKDGVSIDKSVTVGTVSFERIEQGTWAISVQGVNASGSVIALGSSTIVLEAGKTASAHITTQFKQSTGKKGGLSLTLSYPASSLVDFVSASLDGGSEVAAVLDTTDPVTHKARIEQNDIPSGGHVLVFTFRKGGASGSIAAIYRETVNIWDDTISDQFLGSDGAGAVVYNDERVFTIEDLSDKNANLSGIIFTGALAPGFTYSQTNYEVTVTTSPFTFTPVQAADYQQITYTWGIGPANTITSGSSSLNLALASGQSTLKVTVTSPDRSATKTYTFSCVRKYQVTYDANGGTGTVPSDANWYKNGDTVTLAANTGGLVSGTLLFAGWNTQANGNGTHYSTGDTIIAGNSAVTLFAEYFTKISSYVEFNNIRNNLIGNFILTADIDLSSNSDWTPIGTSSSKFEGTLDGNGFTIANLTITGTDANTGLFSYINGAALINVKLKDVDVQGGTDTGGLVGNAGGTNPSTISNCSVSGGTISGSDRIGGLVGYSNSTITKSYTNVTVSGSGSGIGGLVGYHLGTITESFSVGKVTGSASTGGLVGFSNNLTINDCYTSSEVTGITNVGGLVGNFNAGTIKKSYSRGLVTGTSVVGGFIGLKDPNGTYVNDSYYDTNTSGQTDDTGKGVPKTTADMKTQTTYSGWDFTDIWAIDGVSNGGYPYLKCNDIYQYTVTYNGNGNGTGTVPVDNFHYEPAKTITVAGNTGVLTNGTLNFAGWNTKADGSGSPYMPGDSITVGIENVVLFARWAAWSNSNYDFDSYTDGDLGSKGWTTALFIAGDIQVQDEAGHGKILYYNQSGAGYGVSANKAIGVPIDLTNPANQYCLSYDVYKNAWGVFVGLGADLNGDGNITKNDTTEHALMLQVGNHDLNHTQLTLPDGSILTLPKDTVPLNIWVKIRIEFSQNSVTVKKSIDNGVNWIAIWTNQAMGTNLTTADKTNPSRWNMIYIHIEGAVGKIDSIFLEKL